MARAELPKHLIIAGHGRSGTNMVLDLFDMHPTSFCRNEPNELWGTAFTRLGDPMFGDPVPEDFEALWHWAFTRTIRSDGARDRFGTGKDYFRSSLHASLGQAIMKRQKLRRVFLPKLDGRTVEQWPCSALYYDKVALTRAIPVLKILLAPAWVLKSHAAFPTQHVVHVIRRPEDFVQSWWNRYVTTISGGPEQVFADNQPSLARILKHFRRQDNAPQVYSLEGLIVSELWRWRYMNETLLEGLSDSSRYITLPYEHVMADKLQWAERLYSFAGLEMTSACRTSIKDMKNTLFSARKTHALDPALVADAAERVMGNSRFRDKLCIA